MNKHPQTWCYSFLKISLRVAALTSVLVVFRKCFQYTQTPFSFPFQYIDYIPDFHQRMLFRVIIYHILAKLKSFQSSTLSIHTIFPRICIFLGFITFIIFKGNSRLFRLSFIYSEHCVYLFRRCLFSIMASQ